MSKNNLRLVGDRGKYDTGLQEFHSPVRQLVSFVAIVVATLAMAAAVIYSSFGLADRAKTVMEMDSMGWKNRELEVKLVVNGYKTLPPVVSRVAEALSKNQDLDEIIGNAGDLYWHAPSGGVADFVRLRRKSSSSDEGQLTLKASDKGNNVDRVEIDLEVDDWKQARALMLALHGDPITEVVKKYHVFFLENKDTTVSVYQIRGDDRIFVEVEARNRRRLKQLISSLQQNSGLEYQWVKSSVYNMFVEKKAMDLADMSVLEKEYEFRS